MYSYYLKRRELLPLAPSLGGAVKSYLTVEIKGLIIAFKDGVFHFYSHFCHTSFTPILIYLHCIVAWSFQQRELNITPD